MSYIGSGRWRAARRRRKDRRGFESRGDIVEYGDERCVVRLG